MKSTSKFKPSFKLPYSTGFFLSICLPFSLGLAQADENPSQDAPRAGGFVGLGVATAPAYPGADQIRTIGMPIGEYHWANGVYIGGGDSLVGVKRSVAPQLQVGVGLGAESGRKESDSSYLAGMGNVDDQATLHLHANWAASAQWALRSGLQLGAGHGGKGALLKLEVGYTFPLGAATQLRLSTGASLANADYMQTYFGVTALQARTSAYTAYTPSAGLRDVNVGIGLRHQLNQRWSLMGGLSSTSLAGSAKDSPLVRKASNQSAFAAVVYSF
ncbi:MAG: MipA/OmpV family protein [Rhodoferax sp.]|nr:MipA/OmpV family protein [Rhodoferax sp.]